MKNKLIALVGILSALITLIIRNKDVIIKHSDKNKVMKKLSKGLPYVVEYGETVVNNLNSLKRR